MQGAYEVRLCVQPTSSPDGIDTVGVPNAGFLGNEQLILQRLMHGNLEAGKQLYDEPLRPACLF